MNAARLLLLADFLDKLPPERFRFATWVGDTWGGKPDLSCGTTACALGWATTIPEFREAGLRMAPAIRDGLNSWPAHVALVGNVSDDRHSLERAPFEAAAWVFDISEDEAEFLFLPTDDGDHEDEEEYVSDGRMHYRASARDVAARIRDFAAGDPST